MVTMEYENNIYLAAIKGVVSGVQSPVNSKQERIDRIVTKDWPFEHCPCLDASFSISNLSGEYPRK